MEPGSLRKPQSHGSSPGYRRASLAKVDSNAKEGAWRGNDDNDRMSYPCMPMLESEAVIHCSIYPTCNFFSQLALDSAVK